MPPAPARMQVVRPVADNRITDRINYQRNDDGDTNESRVEAYDLAVEQQKEVVEANIVDAVCNGAKAVCRFIPYGQRLGIIGRFRKAGQEKGTWRPVWSPRPLQA